MFLLIFTHTPRRIINLKNLYATKAPRHKALINNILEKFSVFNVLNLVQKMDKT